MDFWKIKGIKLLTDNADEAWRLIKLVCYFVILIKKREYII